MNKTIIKHKYNIGDIVGHNGNIGEITEVVAYIKKDTCQIAHFFIVAFI